MFWIGVAITAAAILCFAVFCFYKLKPLHLSPLSLENTVGQKCIVIEEINNFRGCGMVKVATGTWAARSAYDDEIFSVDEQLSVVAIEGAKLICKKM